MHNSLMSFHPALQDAERGCQTRCMHSMHWLLQAAHSMTLHGIGSLTMSAGAGAIVACFIPLVAYRCALAAFLALPSVCACARVAGNYCLPVAPTALGALAVEVLHAAACSGCWRSLELDRSGQLHLGMLL